MYIDMVTCLIHLATVGLIGSALLGDEGKSSVFTTRTQTYAFRLSISAGARSFEVDT